MAAELLTDASRATDANSNPYAGAQWFFYATGTTTPQNVYADAALNTSLGAVVTADAGGKFVPIYFDSSKVYRGILKSADGATTIYDIDPINTGVMAQLAAGSGAELIGYGDGTVADRLNIVSATRRPAMDGIFSSGADQRAALAAFVADSAANGQVIEWGPIDLSLDAVTAGGNGFRGLAIPSNSHWVFHPDTIFRALPNNSDSYTILNMIDVSRVTLEGNGARVIGERGAHTGITGEFGIGIRIQGSNDIIVRDLHVSDCWGDGWYIGKTDAQLFCERVHLEKISATNCRRNGLALITVKHFRCVDGRFTLTNGTLPQYGIDIEPNDPAEFLQDVEFVRCFTGTNTSFGLGMFLNAMEATTNPVDVRIIDHVDDGSSSAIYGGRAVNIPGLVEVINLKSLNAVGSGITFRSKAASGPKWKLVNPTIINWNRQGSGTTTFGSAILMYSANGDTGTFALGNLDIINPDIRLTSGTGTNAICIIDQRTTTPDPATGVQIIDPINLQGLPCIPSGVSLFSDRYRKSVTTMADASATIGVTGFYVHRQVPALAGSRAIDINNGQEIGLEMVFELIGSGAGQFRLGLPAGVNFSPDAITNDTGFIYSTTKGSRLRVSKRSATEWFVTEKLGTWTTT